MKNLKILEIRSKWAFFSFIQCTLDITSSYLSVRAVNCLKFAFLVLVCFTSGLVFCVKPQYHILGRVESFATLLRKRDFMYFPFFACGARNVSRAAEQRSTDPYLSYFLPSFKIGVNGGSRWSFSVSRPCFAWGICSWTQAEQDYLLFLFMCSEICSFGGSLQERVQDYVHSLFKWNSNLLSFT